MVYYTCAIYIHHLKYDKQTRRERQAPSKDKERVTQDIPRIMRI